MFEDKRYTEQDEMFRSILEEGQEPVPAHVWEGIEADLDKIAHRRLVVMRIRRTAVGIAAAAALAVGLFFSHNESGDIIEPAGHGDMIAVVEPQQKAAENVPSDMQDENMAPVSSATPRLVASASTAKKIQAQEMSVISETPAIDASEAVTAETEIPTAETVAADTPKTSDSRPSQTQRTYATRIADDWPEDEEETQRSSLRAVTLSGLTGTNSTQNSFRVNPMRRPALSSAPKKTGIKETSTNTTYGIPISFGAGVRFDISKKWSIGTGLNYTLLTRKFYGTYTSVDANGVEVGSISSDIRESQHFIGLPVNFYYDIVNQKNINFYTYAGGAVEKCLSDKFQVLDTGITHTEKVQGLQLSANVGLGVEFMLGQYLGIYVDPSLRYYFNNNQPKSIRTVQPLMFGLEMGLRINL